MTELFAIENSDLQALPLADLRYFPAFLGATQAQAAFDAVRESTRWQQPEITLFGRRVLTPRLSCWMGDANAVYRYSNTTFTPEPWTQPVLELRKRLHSALGIRFNSVLLNYYRNGSDAMGWHSDDEPELGVQPLIASLSLGGERRFLLRRRQGGKSTALRLANGSLLVMQGDTQKFYQHSLPRTAKPVQPRLNLTFRTVLPTAR